MLRALDWKDRFLRGEDVFGACPLDDTFANRTTSIESGT